MMVMIWIFYMIVFAFTIYSFIHVASSLSIRPSFDTIEKWKHSNVEWIFQKYVERPMDPLFEYYFKSNKMNLEQIEQVLRQYMKEWQHGRTLAHEKKLVICGLLRNAETQVLILQSTIESWKSYFKQLDVIIVENDSKDMTRNYLIEWTKTNPRVVVLCQDSYTINLQQCRENIFPTADLDPSFRHSPESFRIRKMAFLRNLYLDHLRGRQDLQDIDYILVMDLDLIGTLFLDGLLHSIWMMEQEKQMDAIACNGIMLKNDEFVYYDSFAFVEMDEPYEYQTTHAKRIHDHDVQIHTTQKLLTKMIPIRVHSAFGGACLYRANSLLEHEYIRYHSSTSEELYSCEHVHLHQYLKQIYINPHMFFYILDNPP